MDCVVCKESASKYKCPGCRIKYCSVKCYKLHKEQGCTELPKPQETKKEQPSGSSAMEIEVSEHAANPDRLSLLGESEGVLECLRDPLLRDVLRTVNSSREPEVTLSKALQTPVFVEFVEQCMKVLEPQTN